MKYLGHLSIHDPFYGYLRQNIVPLLDADLNSPHFRVYRLLASTMSISMRSGTVTFELSENFLAAFLISIQKLHFIIWSANTITSVICAVLALPVTHITWFVLLAAMRTSIRCWSGILLWHTPRGIHCRGNQKRRAGRSFSEAHVARLFSCHIAQSHGA